MALLLTAQDLSLAFGWRPLLEHVNFSLENGERVALLGRNGEGKSTLLNVLRGAQAPDDGELRLTEGVRVAYLPQDPPAADARTVRDVVRDGLHDTAALVARYQELLANHTDSDGETLAQLEAQIAAADGWQLENRIDGILQRFALDSAARMAFSARTRPSLRVRRALMPWRIQTSSSASFLSKRALASASACCISSRVRRKRR